MEFINSLVKFGINVIIWVLGDLGFVCFIGVVDKSIDFLKVDYELMVEKVLFCYSYFWLKVLRNVIFRFKICKWE